MAGCRAVVAGFLFEYDTPRIVLIRSRKVGLMNRAVQLLILAYVIGWVFVWEKGYQEVDSVVSSVTTKAKGVAVTNTSELGFRIWDVADYVIPAQEKDSIFIMTNMIITMNQTQGICPEVGGFSGKSRGFAKYYTSPAGMEHRTLVKAYGIRFDIIVFGKVAPLNPLWHHEKGGKAARITPESDLDSDPTAQGLQGFPAAPAFGV
ncbi:P2X purinoceptor 4-like [Trichechus manatus latirostris]|uniref:P2X purinoceptor 4-like n=1 Tax=Trichechus manatus latirostris TaxID=127582 RepID=A0A2Y9RBZ0_TRIMA|nr:P2X purinoceptor 4-like [Trichechus manatus latirostris]